MQQTVEERNTMQLTFGNQVTEPKYGSTFEYVEVNPKLAELWLNNRTRNRNIYPTVVGNYGMDMQELFPLPEETR